MRCTIKDKIGGYIADVEEKDVIEYLQEDTILTINGVGNVEWTSKLHRYFASDCAEHVLPVWHIKYTNDDILVKAIAASRAYAVGEITLEEMEAVGNEVLALADDLAKDPIYGCCAYVAYAVADSCGVGPYCAGASAHAATHASSDIRAEIAWQLNRLKYYIKLNK